MEDDLNSRFHKKQAEELIKQVNGSAYEINHSSNVAKIALAQVHATLANVPDEEEYNGDLGPL